ncbi:uncharacterized protein DUF3618 [Kribbella sp. VKM Ac-2571]|uniref:DUF3618 domain-containing protein n=1 Tax=Kribbella sp. VKM Ac-2571 TaxID=2512222 RepID=UPI00105BEC7B|nr:DUF3618 domain-containing protein [Kribbella sp. VKM Ac-2571]TDO68328.1 uncharacterized protein DUF3618 [Kribbella sp. VKM Ac-2571]
MTTTKNASHREPMTDSETVREDLEYTRQHLADTVQELTRRLNVPHRMKETASSAGHRMSGVAGQTGQKMKQVPGAMKELPATSKRHPKATAAIGGAIAVGAGAAVWMSRRHK